MEIGSSLKPNHHYKLSLSKSLKRAVENRGSTIYLHLVLLFWNQVFTWASVIFRFLARVARSVEAKYFCLWKRFSSSQIWRNQGNQILIILLLALKI